MSESLDNLVETLQSCFGDKLLDCKIDVGEVTIEVAAADWQESCRTLRDHAELKFDIAIDLCGVDYSTYGQDEWQGEAASEAGFSRGVESLGPDQEVAQRYAVVLHLLSISTNRRLRVRAFAESSDFPVIDSLVDVWNGLSWFEREAFDLYGIIFEGHPDLRRLLTDYGFVGHPFRKDFPLTGNVEMRYDPEQQRVIYEPVSIEPRVLVPRVIRDDHRYGAEEVVAEEAQSDGDE